MSPQERPLFSVIIPTYNRADKLEKCLESLEKQTCRSFEAIVCDDGSTDGTREIVQKFSNRSWTLHYLYAPNWGGPARPRNTGLAHAGADWVCFLDSDDQWYSTKLEKCLPLLEKCDVLYHDLDRDDGSGEKVRLRSRQLGRDAYSDLLEKGNTVSTSSVCVRREKILEAGGFSEDRTIIALEDFDLWLKLAGKGAVFLHIPEALGMYWAGGGNITQKSLRQIEKMGEVYKRHFHTSDTRLLRRAKGMLSYCIAGIYFDMGDSKNALRSYRQAFRQACWPVALKSVVGIIRSLKVAYL